MSKAQRRSRANKGSNPAGKMQPPGLAQRLAKAFAHPLRAELLTMLNEKPGSAKDLKDRLGEKGIEESLNLVAYHLRVLVEIKCVELVDTEAIRGATKKIYRGTTRMLLDEGIWPNLSKESRVAISAGAIGETAERAQQALEEGTFDKRKDRAIINLKMNLDERGWKEILKVIHDAYHRCEDIEPEAINRTPDPDERFCTTISLLAYESPEKR